MPALDPQILIKFLAESKSLVDESGEILDQIEGNPSMGLRLLEYVNRVDRVMGAAKSLALTLPPGHMMGLLADCTALCKAVATKAASVSAAKPQAFDITVAFLMDANEFLDQVMERISEPAHVMKKGALNPFMERLRWLANLYNPAVTPAEGRPPSAEAMSQKDVDELLKRLLS